MPLSLAVLGDSIAYGMGASDPADTVGARLTAELVTSGTPTDLRVFAVSGACSDALATQVQAATAWGADVALIIIGANDLTHFVPVQQAAAQLGAAVRALRLGGARVVVCPAPDLSVVPWVPPYMRVAVQAASTVLRQAQASVATTEGARIADAQASLGTAFAGDLSLFSADRFHPSSAGYALISAALAPTVLAVAAEVVDQGG